MNKSLKKPHKFGAKSTHCANGCFHPSLGEARRCETLHLLQKAKEISDLRVHDSLTLVEGFKYKPDFTYMEKGRKVTEDFKGVVTDRFCIICRLWKHHGIGILRVSGTKGITREIEGRKK